MVPTIMGVKVSNLTIALRALSRCQDHFSTFGTINLMAWSLTKICNSDGVSVDENGTTQWVPQIAYFDPDSSEIGQYVKLSEAQDKDPEL